MTDIDLDAILAEIERGEYDEDMLYRAVEALVGRIQDLESQNARWAKVYRYQIQAENDA